MDQGSKNDHAAMFAVAFPIFTFQKPWLTERLIWGGYILSPMDKSHRCLAEPNQWEYCYTPQMRLSTGALHSTKLG